MMHRCFTPRAGLPALIVALTLGLLAAPAGAQWWWPPTGGMIVEPECPHPSAAFDITLWGDWKDSCVPNVSYTEVAGNRIDFFVAQDPPPGFCLLVITPWSRQETVGPLAAGTYEVYATWLVGTTPQGPPVLMGEIKVSPDCPSACYADCDENGSLNIDDFLCFQLAFALGDPYADCDENGSLNIDDFICFQLAFALGC